MRRMRLLGALLALLLAVGASACGSDDDGGSESAADSGGDSSEKTTGTWEGTGSLEGDGEIVVFLPSGGLQFNDEVQAGIKAQAKELGYTTRFFTNAYDQPEQDRQVQQYLATGKKPAGFIIYPPVPDASANAVRQLGRVAPVIQNVTDPRQDPAAYAGAGESGNVSDGGKMAEAYMQLLDELKEKGVKLRSPDGSVLVYNVPEGIGSGDDRLRGFIERLKEEGIEPEIVGEENGMVDRQTGYQLANRSLSKYDDKFDVIWAINLTGGTGVAQALKERGRKPGEDVWVISAGDCTGGVAPIERGDVYSTIAQSPSLEGRLAMRNLARLISHGGYVPGEEVIEDPVDELPPLENTPPPEYDILPTEPIIGPEGVDKVKVWGQDVSEICPA